MTVKKIGLKIPDILQAIIIVAGLYYILCYAFMLSKRFFYPFELEWLESYFASAVTRIINGQPVYAAPNPEFVPFLYPPVYYWISAWLTKIIGPGFTALRSVSVLSSIISAIIIFKFIKKETRNMFFSFTGLCLFISCYGLSDFWYDVARVDSLFLVFVLGGLYTIKYSSRKPMGVIASAVLFTMAFFTKQSAIFFIIMCPVYLWLCKQRFVLFTASVCLLAAGGCFLLNRLSDGWYVFYCFSVPLKHYGIKKAANTPELMQIYGYYTHFAQQNYGSLRKLYLFFTTDLLSNIPFLLIFTATWFIYRFKSLFKSKNMIFFALAGIAAVLCSISMRCKFGGHINGIIPAVTIIIIISMITFSRIYQKLPSKQLNRTLVLLCILMQFIMLGYNPTKHVPKPDDYISGKDLIETISSFKGDVYMPFHPYYAVMAGKKMFAHKMPIDDMSIGYPDKIPGQLFEKISGRQFSAIIYDQNIDKKTENHVEKHIIKFYRQTSEIKYKSPGGFIPSSGFKVRPSVIYTPQQQ